MRIVLGLTDLSQLDFTKVHTMECTTCQAITAHQIKSLNPLVIKCLDHTEAEANIQEDEVDEPVKLKAKRNKPSRKIQNFIFDE
jgi:hypothetical protein